MTDIAAIEESLKPNWGKDQLDPDNWLVVPEFNVMPADVDFQGFALPIVHPGSKNLDLANSLRMLVRITRTLARARFGTQAALVAAHAAMWRALEEERPQATEDMRVSFIYMMAMHNLHAVLERPAHMTQVDVLRGLASAAAMIATWAHEGSEAAVKASQQIARAMPFPARELGEKGARTRWENDPQQRVKPGVKSEWEAWKRGDTKHGKDGKPGTQKEFAWAMVVKFPDAKNADTVQDWCREWKKSHSEVPPFGR